MHKSMMSAAACLLCASPALAGVTITVMESGGDVVMSGSGSLDTSLWTYDSVASPAPAVGPFSTLSVGPGGGLGDLYNSPVNFSGPTSIGFGPATTFADSGTGDVFGLDFATPRLLTPYQYVSGDPLSGGATYVGQTLASLGLNAGSYTWTWDVPVTRSAAVADFFTINIVPAPGVAGMLVLAGLGSARRRR